MEGYLTFQESHKHWVREFFVIQGEDMYYYHKKEDYLLNPAHSVKNRPISLRGYKITSQVRDNGTYEIVLSVSKILALRWSLCIIVVFLIYISIYIYIMQPEDDDDERKSWNFRCDTSEEMQAWGQSFTRGTREM
jgi:hypothetical protein